MYDLRDRFGRKIGTIEPSGPGAGVLILLVIVLVGFTLPITLVLFLISSITHITHQAMPRTFFAAQDATIEGDVTAGRVDPRQLNVYQDGAVTFIVNNTYSEGEFSIIPDASIGEWLYDKVAIFVNDKRLPLRREGGHSYPSVSANLRKGLNTIKLVNLSKTGVGISVRGLYIEDKLCSEGSSGRFWHC